MIPGVPSFCAAAARLGTSLTLGEVPLHIIPVTGDWEALLDVPGTKVLMKAGRRLPQVAQALRERGLLEQSALVRDCGLPTEAVCTELERAEPAGYFTTVIVKE